MGRGVGQLVELTDHPGPLGRAQAAGRIELGRPAQRHAHPRPGVAHQIVLVDQVAIQIAQDGQGLTLGRRRQRAFERTPQRRPALAAARAAPAAARLGVGLEVAVRDAVLMVHRRQRLALLDDGPQQEALGLLAIGPLGVGERPHPV